MAQRLTNIDCTSLALPPSDASTSQQHQNSNTPISSAHFMFLFYSVTMPSVPTVASGEIPSRYWQICVA